MGNAQIDPAFFSVGLPLYGEVVVYIRMCPRPLFNFARVTNSLVWTSMVENRTGGGKISKG